MPTPISIPSIISPPPDDGSTTQRLAHRLHPVPLTIHPANPTWPTRFQSIRSHIHHALPHALSISHVGSTSIPSLPAKDIIDIDLVVRDITDETTYVPQLESIGFRFLLREPGWHEHRFLVLEASPANPDSYAVNLHVFGPDCAEVERHRIFREWLIGHPEDKELYARVKRECAMAAEEAGEGMQEYTVRKDEVVKEILGRAFRELGYIE